MEDNSYPDADENSRGADTGGVNWNRTDLLKILLVPFKVSGWILGQGLKVVGLDPETGGQSELDMHRVNDVNKN